ncbi:DNA mismatch repair protein, putative [Plasmodium malariae]|uniref:DNA mismatch repair protein, putative n=2 Tax=Plasmodium (Plasmodium) TaxID=418103 RepID=A0A1A8WFE8_PLAMA|nr:DNA mismatch repair protein, putative [Plasmodium malariae]SBS89916.1 DNA mismatch repair protein, putative [Plasmodium malariae]SCP02882.1 DNA mismatch repair protein, putative [Plasmodium malariae]
MFNCLSKKKVILINNIKKNSLIFLNRNYVNNLIYTKEDDIYKINGLLEYNLSSNNKNRNDNLYDGNSIISNSNYENDNSLGNSEKDNRLVNCVYNYPNDERLDIYGKINEKFLSSDFELQLYKNGCKIPIYWIKKLEKLKNINAINCLEYLKDDNLLYFDNYKNKGLLKFLNDEKRKYNNCIILSRVGDFYETYGLDSIFLIEFLNIKKMNNKLSCGFIKSSINKALHILTNNNLNVCIYEELNEKSLKMKKRYLSQIVTPELPIYLNNIQYCSSTNEDISNKEEGEDENKNSNAFFNSCDIDDYFVIKEIICIYIESKNIFSLSKINLSLKTISIYDQITFDVLNIYLKNTNFLKVYIHQHNNTSFTKKIIQLFRIENYYLFNNFSNSLQFHMFILEKLKEQINIRGLFRLIKNKNVFQVETASSMVGRKASIDVSTNQEKGGRVADMENFSSAANRENVDRRRDELEENYKLENNFDYAFYSYCTPLNIFTSYNMGIYKQNNYYENRNNYLFYNIIDVNNSDSNSINIAESLDFFKNLFLFYPTFEITKHIRYINEYIRKNLENLIVPNVRPFRNNIVITLLSNLKADHHVLKKIYTNIEGVLKCINNYDFSLLTSIFHVLNHQNSFKLNILKFYGLLTNIREILQTNLEMCPCKFSYSSDIRAFNEFVYYHENEVYNILNEKLLTGENKDIERNRRELLEAVLSNYGEYDENKKSYNLDLLNKLLKFDNTNDIIGIKKKKINNEKILNFFHPLNKKSDVMKNIFVTENVQNKVKHYISSIDRKKKKINELIRRINGQLSSSVHILSFVSNFLQILQALWNHTSNSIKRGWNLPVCKHLVVTYEQKSFKNIDEKLLYIQQLMYNENENISNKRNTDGKSEYLSSSRQVEKNSSNSISHEDFIKLTEEDEKNILENVDKDSVEEIKKIYKEKFYANDSLTYILGAKPYNLNKQNLVKYDIFFKKRNFILLTGKNMSGKTTLSFTILCILFLANLGMYAPCDEKSIISKFREFYSLKNVNYQEQIENMSLFREQAYYINSIIEEIKENYCIDNKHLRNNEIFILFDEPCIATTPVDNAIIISAISDYLKEYCGIIITHNYDLLKKICQSKNIIFKRINENINYLKRQEGERAAKLERGICKNSEALETCRHTNIDSKVLELLNAYEKRYKFIHNLSNLLYYKFLDYLKNTKDKKKTLNNFFENFVNYGYDKSNSVEEQCMHVAAGHAAQDDGDNFELMQNEDMREIMKEYSLEGDILNKEGDVIKKKNYIRKNSKEKTNVSNLKNYDMEVSRNDDACQLRKDRTNAVLGEAVPEYYENCENHEKELNIAIEKIERAANRKVVKIGMNEDIPISFKNKSIVYILCIFAKNKNKPYFYIGISDNISERIKCHTRNLLNSKNLLKNEKRNNILNYKYDMNVFYTLIFQVDNKMLASKYEKELSDLLKRNYDIISK